ncbi:MAG: Uncharacterised protein [Marinobacterium sp. xm-d-530]|nr:MAG: Uncharacterised protein [Marinobacterium sp. xm-d-530]
MIGSREYLPNVINAESKTARSEDKLEAIDI